MKHQFFAELFSSKCCDSLRYLWGNGPKNWHSLLLCSEARNRKHVRTLLPIIAFECIAYNLTWEQLPINKCTSHLPREPSAIAQKMCEVIYNVFIYCIDVCYWNPNTTCGILLLSILRGQWPTIMRVDKFCRVSNFEVRSSVSYNELLFGTLTRSRRHPKSREIGNFRSWNDWNIK